MILESRCPDSDTCPLGWPEQAETKNKTIVKGSEEFWILQYYLEADGSAAHRLCFCVRVSVVQRVDNGKSWYLMDNLLTTNFSSEYSNLWVT